jgi:antirestriction protein ArdC
MTTAHAKITAHIVAALERGLNASNFQLPWHRTGATLRPVNFATGKRYTGINAVSLWFAASEIGCPTGQWATKKQWTKKGITVNADAAGATVVCYTPFDVTPDARLPYTTSHTRRPLLPLLPRRPLHSRCPRTSPRD